MQSSSEKAAEKWADKMCDASCIDAPMCLRLPDKCLKRANCIKNHIAGDKSGYARAKKEDASIEKAVIFVFDRIRMICKCGLSNRNEVAALLDIEKILEKRDKQGGHPAGCHPHPKKGAK
jgi:hypothetical protein